MWVDLQAEKAHGGDPLHDRRNSVRSKPMS